TGIVSVPATLYSPNAAQPGSQTGVAIENYRRSPPRYPAEEKPGDPTAAPASSSSASPLVGSGFPAQQLAPTRSHQALGFVVPRQELGDLVTAAEAALKRLSAHPGDQQAEAELSRILADLKRVADIRAVRGMAPDRQAGNALQPSLSLPPQPGQPAA